MEKVKRKKSEKSKIKTPDLSDTLITQLMVIDRSVLSGMTREFKFHPTRKWRFDLAWVDHRLAVECDGGQRSSYGGGRHNTPGDYEKINEANLLGWTVLRYQGGMILENPQKIYDNIQEVLHGKIKLFQD
tara:strand:+ start:1021 stop:1410 length:390 start_codon:yes stop_codon:yes gene_type:complete